MSCTLYMWSYDATTPAAASQLFLCRTSVCTGLASTACLLQQLRCQPRATLHSLTHWTAWPMMARSTLQASPSLAVSPVLASSCHTQVPGVWCGLPQGVPSSGVRPERMTTASLRAMWAGVVSGSRQTCPNIARRRSKLRRLSWCLPSLMMVLGYS